MGLYVYLVFMLFAFFLFDKQAYLSGYYSYKPSRIQVGLILAFSCILFFTSIRYNVGWDYANYYDAVYRHTDNNIVLNGEMLTVFLVNISRYIKSPFFYFFVNALILYVSLYFFIRKYSVNQWLSFFIFLFFPLFFLNSLSVVRTFTAIALVLYSYKFLIDKKILFFIVIVLIASMFHKAALIALCFIFFSAMNISSGVWLLALLISPFLTNVFTPILTEMLPGYSVYFKETENVEGTRAIFFFVIFAVAMTFFRRKLVYRNRSNLVLYNIYMFSVCIYLLFIELGSMGHRLSLYGTITSIILIPALLSKVRQIDLQFFLKLLLYMLLVGLFYLTLLIGEETYLPYTTIFGI